MKKKQISRTDFTIEDAGHHYNYVTYTNPNNLHAWRARLFACGTVSKVYYRDEPTIKDLNALKILTKFKGERL